jgi:hypothetical protein
MPANIEAHDQRHATRPAWSMIPVLFLLLIGLILLSAGAWRFAPARASRSWCPAKGVIIEARLPSNCAYCWPVINYQYIVDGQSFVGKNLVAGPQDYYNPVEAQAKVAEYIVGRQVTAYYDPKNPAISCLEPGIIRWPAYWCFVTGLGFLSGAPLLWWRVKRRVQRAKGDDSATRIESQNYVLKD